MDDKEFLTTKQDALDDLERMEQRIVQTRVMINEAKDYREFIKALLTSPMAQNIRDKHNKIDDIELELKGD